MKLSIIILSLPLFFLNSWLGAKANPCSETENSVFDLRLEVIDSPKNVSSNFKNLNPQALLYHPPLKSEEKVPLVILLHGAGGTKRPIDSFKWKGDINRFLKASEGQAKVKILVPQSRGHWDPASLNKMLDQILNGNSDIDQNRIYLMGHSMGGKGVWEWAMASPQRFAAIVPMAFNADQSHLKKMMDLPVWAFVGSKDRRRARNLTHTEEELKKLGAKKFRLTLFDGAHHGATQEKAWAEKALLRWLFSQSKLKKIQTQLGSGEYFITQSWSQESNYKRSYLVRVPKSDKGKKLPVLIFLHGNGGHAKGAMRRFLRPGSLLAKKFIIIVPDGYRKSWNIVSERSKAEDRGFIESIINEVTKFENVKNTSFSIMGNSNGAALANQIACETKLTSIKNYITIVSPLNSFQHDGKNFKAKGKNNNYKVTATPLKGIRVLNISGTEDRLIPYEGGPSRHIPAKGGKLPFVDAEESIYIWAKHLGFKGKKLSKPSRKDGDLEIFSYLDGNVQHYKVNGAGHDAGGKVKEALILKFLEGGQKDLSK